MKDTMDTMIRLNTLVNVLYCLSRDLNHTFKNEEVEKLLKLLEKL